MIIQCPACKTKFRFDERGGSGSAGGKLFAAVVVITSLPPLPYYRGLW